MAPRRAEVWAKVEVVEEGYSKPGSEVETSEMGRALEERRALGERQESEERRVLGVVVVQEGSEVAEVELVECQSCVPI